MHPIYFHDLQKVAFSIGNFDVYWYSFAYIIGVLMGYALIKYYNKSSKNFSEKSLDNLIVYVILGIIIGGRIGFILFYNIDIIFNNPIEIFMLRNGGMSFHGGLIGLIAALYLFCYNYRLSFLKVMDLISCVAPIGIFLGRIANFINGELWGKVTNLKWGVIFPRAGDLPRHPSQLYEAAFEGIFLFIILNTVFKYIKNNKYPGMISGLFLTLYGIFRIIIENYREPDYEILGISIGQLLCVPMIFVGLIIMMFSIMRKGRDRHC